MLSIETEARLAKLFLNIADGEKAVEISRQVLGEQLDFDPYQVFKKLDAESKNYIDEFNIVDFLKINSVYCSYEEARFIIFFYDIDTDGKLSYSEFLNLVISENKFSLKRHARENLSSLNTRLTLPFDVEYSLSKVFERELDLVRNLQITLNDLRSRRDFNVYELFSSVQSYSDLSSEDIRKFLIRNGANVDESDLKAIMKRLDLDRDMRVSLYEFRKFLTLTPPSYGKDSYTFKKTGLSSSGSTFFDSKDSLGKTLSSSPFRRFSPQRSNRFESPRTIGKSYLSPERKIDSSSFTTLSPLRRVRSPLRSPVRSPIRRTMRSPLRSTVTSEKSSELSHLSYKYLSLEEETFLAYLKDLIEIENILERAKCDLILRSDFNIDDAFRIFELDGRGFLSELDLKYGLHSLDIFPPDSEISLLFKRFDLRNEGVISFENFFEVFSPLNREYRRTFENRLPSYSTSYLKADVFTVLTKLNLKDLFILFLKYEIRIEGWRQRLNKLLRFNIREFFEKIDRASKNYITENDITNYLQRNEVVFLTRDVQLLLLRFDKDEDDRISYLEFSDEIYPHSKQYFI